MLRAVTFQFIMIMECKGASACSSQTHDKCLARRASCTTGVENVLISQNLSVTRLPNLSQIPKGMF